MTQLPTGSKEKGQTAAAIRLALDSCRDELDDVHRLDGKNFSSIQLPPIEQRLRGVTERLERMVDALEQKVMEPVTAAEALAREADHRIKNSLQIVTSLLQSQAMKAPEEAVRQALQLAASRVAAVAQLHAALVDEKDLSVAPEVDLSAYVGKLCATLQQVAADGGEAKLHAALEPLMVKATMAQSLGLVVSELVINALRHAFQPGQPGNIWVRGNRLNDCYRLCIEDDGQGLPANFDMKGRRQSLGLRLIAALAEQMQVTVTADRRLGACFTLTIPMPYADAEAAVPVPVPAAARLVPCRQIPAND